MLDYEFLRLSWWLLMGILFIGFAITDGFDLGVASLLNFIAKTDSEKRIVINTVGPFWEGNQVWSGGTNWWDKDGGYHKYFHSGFCWVARRSALEDVGGLIETAVVGSGDNHMALALIGKADKSGKCE